MTPIKSKLSEKDFINANFVVLYSKISTILFTVLLLICLLASILMAFSSRHISVLLVVLSFVMCLIVPLKTYIISKQNFTTNKRISETIEYQFDKAYLILKGESFNSQSTWNKIYKLTQTKNWIFVWQNRQIAHPIPKRDIGQAQLILLKEIVQQHEIKNNL